MFDTCQKSRQSLNRAEYRDKVLGCWTGKNIGGTLGAPIEGRREMFDLTFYKQDLNGTPAPNDDLDLQLVWLQAAEERGVYQLNERVLGEYWMAHITGPWNEYGIGKANMANGFQPPALRSAQQRPVEEQQRCLDPFGNLGVPLPRFTGRRAGVRVVRLLRRPRRRRNLRRTFHRRAGVCSLRGPGHPTAD